MMVSKQFMRDFAYLANRYGWTPAEIEEIKQATRVSSELVRYWQNLAIAHQAGYEQSQDNGFMRLQDWCRHHGLPDPYKELLPREDRGGRGPNNAL